MGRTTAIAQPLGLLVLLAACSSNPGTALQQTTPPLDGGDQGAGGAQDGAGASSSKNAGGNGGKKSATAKTAGGTSGKTGLGQGGATTEDSTSVPSGSGATSSATDATSSGGANDSSGTQSSSKSNGGTGGTKTTKSTGASGGTSAQSTAADASRSQCSGKPGPSYEAFFDNSKLATLNVTIDSSALGGKAPIDALWGKWTHCPPHDNFMRASFDYKSADGAGNVTCSDVGIRLRGSWTREEGAMFIQVRGFKLDMQVLDTTSTTHRRFADLNRINILSIENDPSHMLQCLSYELMREFGIPAPLCNHVKVNLNGQFYGLLENVEQVNRGYLRRHFGTNEGYLFAASPSQSDCSGSYKFEDSKARLGYNGDTFSNYSSQYMLDNATEADAEKTLIPMLKCGDATQTSDDAKFKTCIAEWLDVDEWLRTIAAESLMPELESWIGYYRNYYLYFNPDSTAPHGGRFVVWPWDLDTAFQKNTCYPSDCNPFTSVDSLYGPMNARAKFVQRLTSVYKSEYCKLLKDFLSTVYKPTHVDEMAKVIEGQLDSSVTASAWQAEVSALRNHFTTHATSALSSVNANCQ